MMHNIKQQCRGQCWWEKSKLCPLQHPMDRDFLVILDNLRNSCSFCNSTLVWTIKSFLDVSSFCQWVSVQLKDQWNIASQFVKVFAASLKVKGLRNKRQVVDSIVASPQVVGLGPTPRSWWGQDSGFIGWGEIWRAHNNLQDVSRWLSNFSQGAINVFCHWQCHWRHSKSVEIYLKRSNWYGIQLYMKNILKKELTQVPMPQFI